VRRMSALSSSPDLLFGVYAFAIIGLFHTTAVVVEHSCRAVSKIVKNVDDCRLECRESHARLQNGRSSN
jgi:hypothetical protein